MTRSNNNQENLFDEYAYDWWNKRGYHKLLHKLNPLRLEYISSRLEIKNKTVLDIGCGGGILSEELSKMGAKVTGIDSSKKSINIAKKHAKEQDLDIEYINGSILDVSDLGNFDCVVCFEMIEHIHDPKKLIEKIGTVSQNKSHLFMSTINRNLKSFVFAKIFAEYVLNVVPRGTHQYAKFITPYELNNMLEQHNFNISGIDGVSFNPINESFALGNDTEVNYFLHAKK